MGLVNENTFKFILKDKENSHFMPAGKLELILSNLRKFIDSTVDRLEINTSPPQLNVLAQPASSFGIEFEVVTDGFDFYQVIPEVINSMKNLLIDIEMRSEDELYDLVYEVEKYSPKQIKHFSSLSKIIVNSGYDFVYEYTDSKTGTKSKNELTVNNKNNLSKLENTLTAGEEKSEDTIVIDCLIAAVNTNRNGFTIFSKNEYSVNRHLTIKENELLTGLFSETLITDLKNQKTNIPVPCHANIELKIITKTNYNLKNPTTSKYTIKKVQIVEE